MKPKSAQQKGKRFERFVNEQIADSGLGRATRTPGSGSGKIKGDSFNSLPFLLEIKNQKVLKLSEWIDQSREQARVGHTDKDKWALIFRDPRTAENNPQCYAVIDMWQFFELLKKDKEPTIKEPDRGAKWKIERLKQACSDVLRVL